MTAANRLDNGSGVRDTVVVAKAGSARGQLAQTLTAAYGAGLLSEATLSHRLDLLFSKRLVEPVRLVGDITRHVPQPRWPLRIRRALDAALRALTAPADSEPREPALLLALDWGGGQEELLLGRDPSCDVVLTAPTVSRRHARLRFRDGRWILQDLDSTNGTWVNQVFVRRCELHPGDQLMIGVHRLGVD